MVAERCVLYIYTVFVCFCPMAKAVSIQQQELHHRVPPLKFGPLWTDHISLVLVSFQTLDKNETMNLDLGAAPRFVYNIITLQFSSKSHEQARWSDDEPCSFVQVASTIYDFSR